MTTTFFTLPPYLDGATLNAWLAEYGNDPVEGGNFYTGVSISSLPTTMQATIKLVVYGLNPGNTAVIEICSSLNAFNDYVSHAQFTVVGPIGATSDQVDTGSGEGLAGAFYTNPVSFKAGPYDQACSTIPWGQEDAILGLRFSSLTGPNPDLTLAAWFEY